MTRADRTIQVIGRRQCGLCKTWYEGDTIAEAFPVSRQHVDGKVRCICCLIDGRNKRKARNRLWVKAHSTRRHHAKALGLTVRELEHRYDWKIQRLVDDMQHALEHQCMDCGEEIVSATGLRDLTLDIIDPDRPPDYGTNVRWICHTCNREKARIGPVRWNIRRRMWRLWRENRARQWPAGSLFDEAV